MLHHKHKPSQPVFIAGLLVIVVVAYIVLSTAHIWPFSESKSIATNNAATTTPAETNNSLPKQDLNSTTDSSQTSNNIPVNATWVAAITTLNETNDEINFAATVQNAPSTGTCVVTFSNPNDRPVVQQFNATATNGLTTCDVNLSAYEFSYLGNWSVSFRYYVGNQQATTTSEIKIQ